MALRKMRYNHNWKLVALLVTIAFQKCQIKWVPLIELIRSSRYIKLPYNEWKSRKISILPILPFSSRLSFKDGVSRSTLIRNLHALEKNFNNNKCN